MKKLLLALILLCFETITAQEQTMSGSIQSKKDNNISNVSTLIYSSGILSAINCKICGLIVNKRSKLACDLLLFLIILLEKKPIELDEVEISKLEKMNLTVSPADIKMTKLFRK